MCGGGGVSQVGKAVHCQGCIGSSISASRPTNLYWPTSNAFLASCLMLAYPTLWNNHCLWSSSLCVVSCFQHDNKHTRNQTHCCCCVNTICVRSNSNDIHEVLAANTGFSIVEMRHHFTTPPLPSANQQRKNSA